MNVLRHRQAKMKCRHVGMICSATCVPSVLDKGIRLNGCKDVVSQRRKKKTTTISND